MVRRTTGKVNYASNYNDNESDASNTDSESDDTERATVAKRARKGAKSSKKTKAKAKKNPRQKISKAKARKPVTYASESESDKVDSESESKSDSESEDNYSSDDYESSKKSNASSKRQPSKSSKKGKNFYRKEESEFPPVSEMVIDSIKALKDNPKKGSTLGSIKETISLNWPVNLKVYDSKIKKFITKAIDRGEIIQIKGPGFRGRFTVPGLKARKSKKKKSALTKKFDEDEEEYTPQKTARDEERERDLEELERKRKERRILLAKEEERKASLPKRAVPKRDSWEVEAIKGKREKNGEVFYMVKFKGWNKPQWEPEDNVQGCDEAISEFFKMEEKRNREETQRKKREVEEGAYEVKRIIEVKFLKNKKKEFLIRWVGHSAEDDTWEPEENLNCSDLIEKFMVNWEKTQSVEDKRLRDYRKPVERLAFAGFGSRSGKRGGGFRVTYDGMDE